MRISQLAVPFAVLSIVCPRGILSQASAAAPVPSAEPGEIRGRLADSATGRTINVGSITVRRLGDSLFAGGALPRTDGSFRVDGLRPGSYSVRIRAVGYEAVIRSGVLVTADAPAVDLGTIALAAVVRRLERREIVAERDDQVLAPDRNTYHTRNMSAAAGGNALDVLRNIPALEVDGNDRVRLRGNENVVVQVNGRSTPLTGEQLTAFLAQLPARLIRSVEVATNPSARSDPEGTAGIINVVLDQDAELALSGGVSVAVSTTTQVNLAANVARQRGPLTLFASIHGYHDRRGTSGTISRTNLERPMPAYVETRLNGTQTPRSAGGTLRTEYRLNERHAATLEGYLFAGHYGGDQSSSYTDLDTARVVIGAFDQYLDQLSRSTSQRLVVGHHLQGAPSSFQGRTELEYWNNGGVNDADRSGDIIRADASMPGSIATERDRARIRFSYWNFKSDFTKTLGARGKLETGVRVVERLTTNDFEATRLTSTAGGYVTDSARSSALDYRESNASAYAVLSGRAGPKLQAQGGLRLERIENILRLPTSGARYDGGYGSAFPSAALSYDATKHS